MSGFFDVSTRFEYAPKYPIESPKYPKIPEMFKDKFRPRQDFNPGHQLIMPMCFSLDQGDYSMRSIKLQLQIYFDSIIPFEFNPPWTTGSASPDQQSAFPDTS